MSPELAERLAVNGMVDSARALLDVQWDALPDAARAGGTSAQQIVQIRDQASRLAPRLIWDEEDVNDFENILRARRERVGRRSFNSMVRLILLVFFILVTLAIAALSEVPFLIAVQTRPAAFAPFFTEVRAASRLVFLSGWLLVAVLPAAFIVEEFAEALIVAGQRRLARILANTRSGKRFWLAVGGSYDIVPMIRTFRSAAIVVAILLGLAIVVLGILYISGAVTLEGDMTWVIALATSLIIPVLLAVIVYDALKIRQKLQSGLVYSQALLMRYLLYRLVQAVSIPVLVFVFVMAVSFGLEAQQWIVEHAVTPAYDRHIDQAVAEFDNLPEELSSLLTADPEAYLADLTGPPTLADAIAVKDPGFESYFRSIMVIFIVWVLIVITIGYFLVPFLLTRRFREAILFVVLTIAASLAETFLSGLVESVAGLPAGSVVSTVLLLLIIVFNAAAFETVESLEDGGQVVLCPSCSGSIPAAAAYCLHCGTSLARPAEA
jgi:hypothetical protein